MPSIQTYSPTHNQQQLQSFKRGKNGKVAVASMIVSCLADESKNSYNRINAAISTNFEPHLMTDKFSMPEHFSGEQTLLFVDLKQTFGVSRTQDSLRCRTMAANGNVIYPFQVLSFALWFREIVMNDVYKADTLIQMQKKM